MKEFLIVGLLFLGVMLPTYSYAQTTSGASTEANLKILVALQAQIQALRAELAELNKGKVEADTEEEWKFNYAKSNLRLGTGKDDVTYDEDDQIRRYLVRNNRLYENEKWTKNTKTDEYGMWNLFAEIAGDAFVDDYITRYATYRIADTGVLGLVQIIDDNEPSWGLAVNSNAADFSSEKWTRDLVGVLIHEYSHILTLNGDQVNHKQKLKTVCKGNYLSNKGCSKKDSYINSFVSEFWSEEDFSRKTPSKKKYFTEHPDEFVTEYALKSPEEDIAESFTQFVLYEKPTGTKKKDLKVLFFYDYPELVETRTRIRDVVEKYYVK